MDTCLLEKQRSMKKHHDAKPRGVKKRFVNGKWNGKWKAELRDDMLPKKKLWVGTFDTREMAENAFDAVLHYLDRGTSYRTYYPKNYFSAFQHGPPKDAAEWKTVLQEKAKEYSRGPVPATAHVPAAPEVVPAAQDTATPSNMPTQQETTAVELQRPTPGCSLISSDSVISKDLSVWDGLDSSLGETKHLVMWPLLKRKGAGESEDLDALNDCDSFDSNDWV